MSISNTDMHDESRDDAPSDDGYLTIGALAKACGITVRTLRYYEEMDLIRPIKRTAGKYRLYNQRSLKRIHAILALQDLNFSLEQIVEMLGPYSEAALFSKEQRIAATRQSLKLLQDQVDDKLVSLQDIRKDLNTRMQALGKHCEPCLEQEPDKHCHDTCEHRDLHLN